MLATVNSLCVYTIYFLGNRFFNKAKRIRDKMMFKTNIMGDDPMVKSEEDVFQILTNIKIGPRTKGKLKTQNSNGCQQQKNANAFSKTQKM